MGSNVHWHRSPRVESQRAVGRMRAAPLGVLSCVHCWDGSRLCMAGRRLDIWHPPRHRDRLQFRCGLSALGCADGSVHEPHRRSPRWCPNPLHAGTPGVNTRAARSPHAASAYCIQTGPERDIERTQGASRDSGNAARAARGRRSIGNSGQGDGVRPLHKYTQ